MALLFNGNEKTITVESGVESLTAEEVYMEWKQWLQEQDNAKYEQAFRVFGGEPTIGGQSAPSYFFLKNNWRIIINNINIVFNGNLYTEEEESPFINQNSNITHLTTDASTVTTGTMISQIDKEKILALPTKEEIANAVLDEET